MKITTAIAAVVLALAPGSLAAQETAPGPQEIGYGEAEFLNSCAVCHGEAARGDGPLADQLTTPPSDLTRLREKNGGAFPYYRVFAVIDGRYVVPGHGPRDMPVWGRQFLDDDVPVFGPNGGEIVTSERIHQLSAYIESLQK